MEDDALEHNIEHNMWLAINKLNLDDRLKAIKRFHTDLEGSSDPLAWKLLGDYYREQNNYEKMMVMYQKGVDVKNAECLFGLGYYYDINILIF